MPKKEAKKDTHVYVQDKHHAWVPAKIIDSKGDKATVEVYTYSDEQSIQSGGKGHKSSEQRTVNLKDYAHKVLPLQNLSGNGTLQAYSDMVQLPYLHEVRGSFEHFVRRVISNVQLIFLFSRLPSSTTLRIATSMGTLTLVPEISSSL